MEEGRCTPELTDTEETEQWERLQDLQNYYFHAGFASAGPGKNPDEAVMSFFESKMGIEASTRVIN